MPAVSLPFRHVTDLFCWPCALLTNTLIFRALSRYRTPSSAFFAGISLLLGGRISYDADADSFGALRVCGACSVHKCGQLGAVNWIVSVIILLL